MEVLLTFGKLLNVWYESISVLQLLTVVSTAVLITCGGSVDWELTFCKLLKPL